MHRVDFGQVAAQRASRSHLDPSDRLHLIRGLHQARVARRLSGVLWKCVVIIIILLQLGALLLTLMAFFSVSASCRKLSNSFIFTATVISRRRLYLLHTLLFLQTYLRT